MQLFSALALVSAFASVALAQSAPPECAFSCLTSTNTHGCSITDNSCLCHNSQFIADQTACITQACTNPSDLQQAQAFAQQNCLMVGVTLSATPTGTGSGSSPSATSPSSGSSGSSSGSSESPSGSSSGSAAAPTNSNAASTLQAPAVLLAGVAAFAIAL